ncbi:MAG: ribosome-binding ATPase [Candidatus Dependentiae bacterium]|nr:ribosome-binding ATPase [Candidatus Dependentiae bacterium]
MAIQAGLVGLPNVGKSTLFNALTKSSIPAQNYPFCTVDPHLAITNVPDERLGKLAAIFGSQKLIPTTVQFVDIAGLVKGAAKGEGLGNQFLSNIMGVDLILHVLRCFEDESITHVNNTVDPLGDFETIATELCLKDIESAEKRMQKIEHQLRKGKQSLSTQEAKALDQEMELLTVVKPLLDNCDYHGVQNAIFAALDRGVTTIPLLSGKKAIFIANVSEDDLVDNAYKNNKHYQTVVARFGQPNVIAISAKIESELAQMDEAEAKEMMESLGFSCTGLSEIIRAAYARLGLISFFTCGPKEAHAWSIMKNTKVPQAAGTIHSDLERGFICAEVYNCNDLFEFKTEAALKSAGKMRVEGKEYVMTDGDVIHVRFNV